MRTGQEMTHRRSHARRICLCEATWHPRLRVTLNREQKLRLPLFEIALVFVRLHNASRVIVRESRHDVSGCKK